MSAPGHQCYSWLPCWSGCFRSELQLVHHLELVLVAGVGLRLFLVSEIIPHIGIFIIHEYVITMNYLQCPTINLHVIGCIICNLVILVPVDVVVAEKKLSFLSSKP